MKKLILKNLIRNFLSVFSELRPENKIEKKILQFSIFYFSSIALIFFFKVENTNLIYSMGFDTQVHIDGDDPRLTIFKVLKWSIRHPLFCLIYGPVLAFTTLIEFTGINIQWYFLILLSSVIMSFCILLLFKISRQLGVSLFSSYLITFFFASFSYVILLSIQVESFLLTLFFSLLFILVTLKQKTNTYTDNIFFFFLVGTTSTNFLKLLAVDFILEKKIIQAIKRFLLSIQLFSVIFLFTILGLFYRRFILELSWQDSIFGDVFEYTNITINKFSFFWKNFLTEPLMFHSSVGVIYEKDTSILSSYPYSFYNLILLIIFILVLLSVFLNRKEVITKIFISFISIDLLIHFGFGYGVNEAQLFSAHWFFFIPILLGLLIKKLTINYGKTAVQVSIGAITVLFLTHNLYSFINSLNL